MAAEQAKITTLGKATGKHNMDCLFTSSVLKGQSLTHCGVWTSDEALTGVVMLQIAITELSYKQKESRSTRRSKMSKVPGIDRR